MMTLREVFDKVKTHLLAQNKRAVEDKSLDEYGNEPNCLYRAPDGTKCAAGCLIDDEHYSPSLEGKTATSYEVKCALMASGVPEEAFQWCGTDGLNAPLIRALQRLHDDDGWGPEFWPAKLDAIERRYFGGGQ